MIPSKPVAFTCRLPVQSFLLNTYTSQCLLAKTKAEIKTSKVTTAVWIVSWMGILCVRLGASQKLGMQTVKSLFHFSWQQSLLTWKHIIKQNLWTEKRDWFLFTSWIRDALVVEKIIYQTSAPCFPQFLVLLWASLEWWHLFGMSFPSEAQPGTSSPCIKCYTI